MAGRRVYGCRAYHGRSPNAMAPEWLVLLGYFHLHRSVQTERPEFVHFVQIRFLLSDSFTRPDPQKRSNEKRIRPYHAGTLGLSPRNVAAVRLRGRPSRNIPCTSSSLSATARASGTKRT